MSQSVSIAERAAPRGDLKRARRRGFLIGAGVVLVIAAVWVVFAGPLIERQVHIGDDRQRGERMSVPLGADPDRCEEVAEALYDHSLFPISSGTYDREGWAPRSEKAFYAGCTGSEYLLGD